MTKEKGIPQIRFSGFTDTWEQRELIDEVASIDTGKSKFTPQESGQYEILGSTSVIGYDDTYDYEGDFLLTARVGANAGELYRYSGKVKISDNTVFIKGEQLDFVYYALLHFDIKRLSFGTGQPLVKASELKVQEIMMPVEDTERTVIGEYFANLDRLITLHQRKYDKLTKVKKAMLEKMFPKNGSLYPEIRFKGFTDAWEQRKLGEISESFEYGLNAAATEYDGKHKYIRITDIDDSTHLFLQDDLTSPDIDFSTADDYLLQEGDVLFARTGASVGKTYIYRRSDGDLYFAGFLIRAKIKSDYDADFVFQNTLTDSYDSYIRITSQRSGQPGVNAQEYANFALSVPSLAEQKKIGAYFSHLDSLITLHQRKLEKLKNIKKACLEKMFV